METPPKVAIAFLTTDCDETTIAQVRQLQKFANTVVLSERSRSLQFPKELCHWEFSVDEFPFETIAASPVPGSTPYAALLYLLQSDCEYVWFLEDDVVLNGGDWGSIVKLSALGYDFIGVDIHPVERDWYWLNETRIPQGNLGMGFHSLKTLCGVCCFSRKAAQVVVGLLQAGFKGHHEMMIPSLVSYAGLTLFDLRRLGFVDSNFFRFDGAFSEEELLNLPPGIVVHPVKDKNEVLKFVGQSSSNEPRSVRQIFSSIGGMANSCSLEEYELLANRVRVMSPCRFLVIGMGRDSEGWVATNTGGKTVFIENDEEWRGRYEDILPENSVFSVEYTVPFEEWARSGKFSDSYLRPVLDSAFDSSPFDVIFVDGPWGETLGRHQSIYLASQLVRSGGLIAVHDCERPREKLAIGLFLPSPRFSLVEQVGRLNVYRAL